MKPELKRPAATNVALLILIALIAIVMEPLSIHADDTYQQVDGWGLPVGGIWGVMSAVGVDANDNVFAFKRSDPDQKTPTLNSKVMVFDSRGKLLRSWGENFVLSAHGLRVDSNGFVWITDKIGDQVFKFNPNGELLMTLGKKGVAGDMDSTDALNGPSDVVVAKNGDIFVSDGESSNARIVKFSKDGTFIKYWGTKGSGPGQLQDPHSIALDSAGNVYVANRINKRIEVFDSDGKYLNQLPQFGAPACIYITKDDILYVAAGAPQNWIAIGTTDGKVLGKISGLHGPHWVAVDSTGAVYVAEVPGMSLKKFVKK
ncbi:MAG TPA: peptidyl-alpha-hydroxyglycine alpha-amidating lyase family protein [Candidatus Acidoferrales bacterium]|jgi:streptogramin lyase|nr:peptidyl-alpha-hydroxyglycine alpha-amidating lyase family protein [Candidatus Acidoferrales bacterium]